MGIRFEFLKAYNGDSILISTENSNILIDGGIKKTYSKFLKPKVENLRESNRKLDLVILTHIDSDHIDGLVELVENEKKLIEEGDISSSIIKKVWFNAFEKKIFSNNFSNETSFKGYLKFKDFMIDLENFIEYDDYISIDNQIEYSLNEELKITLISPNNARLEKLNKKHKEAIEENFETSYSKDIDKSIEELISLPFIKDISPENGVSIAFVLEYEKKKYLFLGDAHIDFIVEVLRGRGYSKEHPLEVDFIKLSHHGSKKNINQDFLDLVRSNNFIILTSGASYGHPDKEALSRIIMNPNRDFDKRINFLCNYENIVEENPFSYDEEERYNFELIYKNELLIGINDEK